MTPREHKFEMRNSDVISIDQLEHPEVYPLAQKQKILMTVLQKITYTVNESLTAEEALRVCLEHVCRHTGWVVGHACALRGEHREHSANVWYLAARKRCFRSSRESLEIESLPSLLQRVLTEKGAIHISHLLNDGQFRASEVVRTLGLRAGSAFPICTGKEIGGVLEFFSDREMSRDTFLLQFLTNVGIQLGRVVERAQAKQSISRLWTSLLCTQDDERRRIARELHDGTGQNLVAIKIQLVTLLNRLSDRSRIGSELTNCCELVDECVREIRTASYLLHPPLLDELGLADAVRYYAKGYAKRSQVEVNVDVDPALHRLERHLEMAFFRIVQEALTNIHRHSGSRTARIRIGCSIDETFVEIADSGKGMPETDPYGNPRGKMGVGIASMRERVEQLNGRLEISSTSRGTIVRASIPQVMPV